MRKQPSKAILKFGGFTQMIDIPEVRPTIYTIHPQGKIAMHDGNYGNVTAPVEGKRLEFDFKHTEFIADIEVAIYEFARIA